MSRRTPVGAMRPAGDAPSGDPASRRWVEQLHADHPRHEQAVGQAPRRPAARGASRAAPPPRAARRRSSGPEFDDVAQQCADDAMMKHPGQARRLPRAQPLHDLGLQVRDLRGLQQGRATRVAPSSAQRRGPRPGSELPDRARARARRAGGAPRAARRAGGGDRGRPDPTPARGLRGDRPERRPDRRAGAAARLQPQRDLQEPLRRPAQAARLPGRCRLSAQRRGGRST